MKINEHKDFVNDDSTVTVHRITATTSEGCVVSEREYEYPNKDDPTGDKLKGLEIVLQVPKISTEDLVYRTLESLQETAAEELSLVEDE